MQWTCTATVSCSFIECELILSNDLPSVDLKKKKKKRPRKITHVFLLSDSGGALQYGDIEVSTHSTVHSTWLLCIWQKNGVQHNIRQVVIM